MTNEQQFSERGFLTISITADDLLKPHHLDKLTILLFCTDGSALVEVNMEQFRVELGSRICYTNAMMMNVLQVTEDFKASALVMHENFSFEALVGVESEMLQWLFNQPVGRLSNDETWELLKHMFEAIHIYNRVASEHYHPAIPQSIFRSMMIVLGEDYLRQSPDQRGSMSYSMADSYFRRFITMVNEHVRQEHEVAYYAAQLNITSKYLNEIAKHKSGHKAKELISAVLLSLIKREMRYSSKSIKELAEEFHFADQSSMGKFFRKLTGSSPLAYKRSIAHRNPNLTM